MTQTIGGFYRSSAVLRAMAALLVAAAVGTAAPATSTASDDTSSFRDLATGSDYRLRVAAALSLGKSSSPGARVALEKALSDGHPAVRAAAAAGLGALGDARAIPALKSALASESTESVRGQIETTLKRLASGSSASAARPKFLVSLGRLDNKSGVTHATLGPALKTSTRSRMAQVPGVEVVADGADVAAEGRSRHLPAFTVDGSLTQLAKKQDRQGIGYAARVEYVLRKIPDHTLKATMSGSGGAVADAHDVHGQSELSQLEVEAVSAAVDSALKSASPVFEAAMR